MSRRRLILALALVVPAASCARAPLAEVDLGEGRQFVPQVVDSLDDVGFMPAVAVDADGNPYIASFGFPDELAPGEIPVARPVGSPFVPGVLLAARQAGVWSRGAVAMLRDGPAGVEIPFGPATVEELASMTRETVSGIDLAFDEAGGLHVAWVVGSAVWYASNADGTAFIAQPVTTPDRAPGAPSVAVGADGTPWVAYTAVTEDGQEVLAARPRGKRWVIETVAAVSCAACPQAGPTEIGVGPDGEAVVAYVDAAREAVAVARRNPSQVHLPQAEPATPWVTEQVEAGAGEGLSMAVDGRGAVHLAYYAEGNEVHSAGSSRGGWEVATVAQAGSGPGGRSTGIAVDDQGAVHVTWYDGASDSVALATSGPQGYTFEETRGAEGGSFPDIAATPDGSSIFVAWYDRANGDLVLGAMEDVAGLALAPTPTVGESPSPSPTTASPATPTATPPAEGCPEGTIELVAAPGSAVDGFDQTELRAPAGEEFTICFDNRDTGVMHNAAVLTEQGGALIAQTEVAPGSIIQLLTLGPLEAGDYFYLCIVHPDTMTGTLIVE